MIKIMFAGCIPGVIKWLNKTLFYHARITQQRWKSNTTKHFCNISKNTHTYTYTGTNTHIHIARNTNWLLGFFVVTRNGQKQNKKHFKNEWIFGQYTRTSVPSKLHLGYLFSSEVCWYLLLLMRIPSSFWMDFNTRPLLRGMAMRMMARMTMATMAATSTTLCMGTMRMWMRMIVIMW